MHRETQTKTFLKSDSWMERSRISGHSRLKQGY